MKAQHLEVPPRPGLIVVAGSRRSPRLLESEEQERLSPWGLEREREMAAPAEDSVEEIVARAPNTKTYPFNSRRLTASVMGRIARELGVGGSASLEDLRQIVGGEMGHSPWNVQVDLAETERGVVIARRDDEGLFLECQPGELEDGDEERGTGGGDADGGGGGARERDGGAGGGATATAPTEREAALETEVGRLTVENATLQVEVSELSERVEGEKKKYKCL